jgi:hypothetical protein
MNSPSTVMAVGVHPGVEFFNHQNPSKMVTVTAAHLRENEKGSYVSLEIQGDLEFVQSQNTGRFYATARKCFISSTFNEQTAQKMIGKEIPGKIVRTPCDPYDYTIPETGEVIQRCHRYDYEPEEAPMRPIAKEEVVA